jgi:hypothetical protein
MPTCAATAGCSRCCCLRRIWRRWAYNAAHTYAAPAALLAFGVGSGTLLAAQIALIWFAHIGMDRTVGYGLKFSDSAKHTHLS